MARKDGESVLRKVVTLSDVAALTVQSERSIQRLVKSGVIRLAKDRQRRQLKGRFVLGDCIPRICKHLRDQMTAADPNAAAYAEARAKSALLATCNSNGLRSIKCRYMTWRTLQSFRGGTMLTSSTLSFSSEFKSASLCGCN
jgi:hypothetical protein